MYASFSAISVKEKWFIKKESELPRLGRQLHNNSLLLICSNFQ